MIRWLVGLLPLLAQLVMVSAQGHIFASVPNLVRVGNNETILVNVFNTEGPVSVTITLKNEDGSVIAGPQTADVQSESPCIFWMYIDPENVMFIDSMDEAFRQYAKVEVSAPTLNNYHEVKDVLLTYEQGFVFIQTDKPIYTPDQQVSIRLMVLDQFLRSSEQKVQLDVLSPQGVIVQRKEEIRPRKGFATHVFRFPHEPLFGNWSVVASYGLGLKFNRSIQFEVKEYVLPTFSVRLSTPPYILESDAAIECSIEAKYVFGHPVVGKFYAKVGIIDPEGDIVIKKTPYGELVGNGRGFFLVGTNELELDENWAENVGSRLYVEVSVVETSSGLRENVSDTSSVFVHSPYILRTDRTVRYYKKGLPYILKVDLYETNGRKAGIFPVQVNATAVTSAGVRRAIFGSRDQQHNPGQNIQMTNTDGQLNIILYIPEDCDSVEVKMKTMREDLKKRVDGVQFDHNALLNVTIEPHISPSVDDFLIIRLLQENVNVDTNLNLEAAIETNDAVYCIAFYVISRGTITQAGLIGDGVNRITRPLGFQVRITFDMAPSARIVAYYINQAGQVIADSLWLEIQKRCENQILLNVKFGNEDDNQPQRTPALLPDQNVRLQVDAFTNTTVGLLAVDKAVYLLQNYHRLTSEKMFRAMDTHDIGCGAGGGRDTPGIFKNAGIMVLSSASLEVDRREAYGCGTTGSSRKRRSAPGGVNTTCTEPSSLEYKACRKGRRAKLANQDCEDRLNSAYRPRLIESNPGLTRGHRRRLVGIFMECCQAETDPCASYSADRGRSSGGREDNVNIADFPEPVNIRSDFRETWIFEQIEIDDNGFKQQVFTVPSSITEWSVSAVGLSKNHAMCVATPKDLLVRKDFFVKLHLPYSVVRKEQVEIVATVYNYLRHDVTANVFIKTTDKICTEGNADEFSGKKEIDVPSGESVSVKYVLIGLKVGEHPVEIYANTTLGTDEDALRKKLRVIPEGVERSYYHSATLDPQGALSQPLGQQPAARASNQEFRVRQFHLEGTQVNHLSISLPDSSVPDSDRCEISIIGSVLGPVVTSVIDGLESLLRLPRGCGEQTMIYMAPNVYVLRYLASLDAATTDFEAAAKNNIREGVIKEMTHRRSDGSYSVWGSNANYPSSTWLTAFVNKVFCHSAEFDGVFVDPKIICQAMEWLIDSSQQEDGSFQEVYRVHHREMTGGVSGDATLTAFVLISLHECGCPTLGNKVSDATTRATGFLSDRLWEIQRPYAMAIVTYALALVGSPVANDAKLLLGSMDRREVTGSGERRFWEADDSSLSDSEKPYWYRVRPSAITVETTGYALLAHIALRDTTDLHSVVEWLSEQQNYGGGFASTQDTVIALQALSEYASLNSIPDMDLRCSVSHEEQQVDQFRFRREDALVQRHSTTPAFGTLKVNSTGLGTGKLNIKVTYNTISEEINERSCPFEILINAREARAGDPAEPDLFGQPPRGDNPGRSRVGRLEKRQAQRPPDRGQLIVRVSVEVGYHKNEPTNMAIIDVGLYTGFKPIKEDLDQIVQDSEYISRYEVSQRSVVFYADEIPPVDRLPKLQLEFNARREFIVGNLQPVAIKVYDYYNPTEECVKFYHPTSGDETGHLLANICEGDTCVCAAGDCFNCGGNPTDVLLDQSCDSAQTYAYRIRIISVRTVVGFKVINATIADVLKAADDNFNIGDNTREFWISTSCLGCLTDNQLRRNSHHLVIGSTVLPYENKNGFHSFKYILDNSATMETWPDNRKRRLREQFDKMQEYMRAMESGNNRCQ